MEWWMISLGIISLIPVWIFGRLKFGDVDKYSLKWDFEKDIVMSICFLIAFLYSAIYLMVTGIG